MGIAERVRFPQFHNRIMDAAAAAALIPHGATVGMSGFTGAGYPKALPQALSPDEANRLLDAASDELIAVRDQAMFELFYSSGLRLAELAAHLEQHLAFGVQAGVPDQPAQHQLTVGAHQEIGTRQGSMDADTLER